MSKIGFIGLGIMGFPMARNLLKAGYSVIAYNRTRAKTEKLSADAAEIADSPREVAEKAEIIIMIVTDTPDVEAVLFGPEGVAAGAKPGTIVVDMSTISPIRTQEFSQKLAQQQVEMLDAPVSGGDIGAQKGTLTIMVGGNEAAYQKCVPLFEVMGSRVTQVGPSGSGQMVKMCNQILCAVNMLGVCESLSLAKKSGLNLEKMLNVVTAGAGGSWALQNLGTKIIAGELEPAFMVKLIQKDLRLVLEAAQSNDLPLPATALSNQFFAGLEASGEGELGTQAMIKIYERLGNFEMNK
ncbi:2-hydroxy-3-oxopropionate reductase [Candidatus Woesearchaeota archaeon]|nr:MAG: 2-hydroxy-3-oxopropionate reductase [Candidatus Woesearchaeota archaeon]